MHAWGKEKYRFFGTDYVDQDYGTYEGRDAEQADLEESEAKLLQKELIDQFSGDDFSLNALNKLALQGDKEFDSKDVTKSNKQAKESSLMKATRTLIDDVKSKKTIFLVYKNVFIQNFSKIRNGKRPVDACNFVSGKK